MVDISARMRMRFALDEALTAKARGAKGYDATIQLCETYFRLNQEPAPHDFITLSQPAERDAVQRAAP